MNALESLAVARSEWTSIQERRRGPSGAPASAFHMLFDGFALGSLRRVSKTPETPKAFVFVTRKT